MAMIAHTADEEINSQKNTFHQTMQQKWPGLSLNLEVVNLRFVFLKNIVSVDA